MAYAGARFTKNVSLMILKLVKCSLIPRLPPWDWIVYQISPIMIVFPWVLQSPTFSFDVVIGMFETLHPSLCLDVGENT